MTDTSCLWRGRNGGVVVRVHPVHLMHFEQRQFSRWSAWIVGYVVRIHHPDTSSFRDFQQERSFLTILSFVCLSVELYTVAKRYNLQQTCLHNWNCPIGTRCYNFQLCTTPSPKLITPKISKCCLFIISSFVDLLTILFTLTRIVKIVRW